MTCDYCGSKKGGIYYDGKDRVPNVYICRDCFLEPYDVDAIRDEKRKEKRKRKPLVEASTGRK